MFIVTAAQHAREDRDGDEEVVRAQMTASLLKQTLHALGPHLNI